MTFIHCGFTKPKRPIKSSIYVKGDIFNKVEWRMSTAQKIPFTYYISKKIRRKFFKCNMLTFQGKSTQK